MKKIICIILCVCFCFLCGCQNFSEIESAHISNLSNAISRNYAIKVVLDNENRFKDKYVDLQIKSNKDNQDIKICKEFGNEKILNFQKKDFWYNLTELLPYEFSNKNENVLQLYQNYGNKIFSLSSFDDVKLSFRIVLGDNKDCFYKENCVSQLRIISKEISLNLMN